MHITKLLILIGTFPIVAYGGNEPPPTARELEKKVFDYRRSLDRGHIVLRESHTVYRNNPNYLNIVRTYDLTFDGQNIRSIVGWKHPEWERTTRALVSGSNYIQDDNTTVPVKIGEWKDPDKRPRDAIHPALLGLLNASISEFHARGLEHIFRFTSNSPNTEVAQGDVAGEKAWRIDYRDVMSKLHTNVIVVTKFGYGVTSIGVSHVADDGQLIPIQTTTSEYTRYGSAWYPSKTIYRQTSKRGVEEEEIMVVERAEFGVKVAPGAFEIGGLDLPIGRKVLDAKGFIKTWDGDRAVHRTRINTPSTRRDPPIVTPNSRLLWWPGSLIYAGVFTSLLICRLLAFPRS